MMKSGSLTKDNSMITTSDVIKKRNEDKLKFEVGYARERVVDIMGYLNLADDDRTKELYAKLDHALVEILKVETILKGENNEST